jgi:hypothetical protein
MGAIPPVGAIPHSATFDFSPLVFVPLRLKEMLLEAGSTEASGSSSFSSILTLAIWREGNHRSGR